MDLVKSATKQQKNRFWFQAGFFTLFVLAPPLDLFRFDLTQNHFFFLGQHWTLGLDASSQAKLAPDKRLLIWSSVASYPLPWLAAA